MKSHLSRYTITQCNEIKTLSSAEVLKNEAQNVLLQWACLRRLAASRCGSDPTFVTPTHVLPTVVALGSRKVSTSEKGPFLLMKISSDETRLNSRQ